MKKTKLLMPLAGIAALGAVAPVVAMTSCNKGGETVKFTVTFDLNDGVTPSTSVEVVKDTTVAKPEDPVDDVWDFTGWFTDKQGGDKFDFNTKITKSITLYAHWKIKEVDSLIIDHSKVKKDYKQGELFNLDNLVLQARLVGGKIIDVPPGYFESDPVVGKPVDKLGKQMVTITCGGKTAQFEINVVHAVTKITATCRIDLSAVEVGFIIYRTDFIVTATYSDGAVEDVYDWTSNIFPNDRQDYMFREAGEQPIIIEFGGQQWSTSANVYYSGQYLYNMPHQITLPMISTGDKAFKSIKQITVLDNGVPLAPAALNYTVASGDQYIEVSDSGQIKTKAVGTGTIRVTDKNGAAILSDLTINVVDVSAQDKDVEFRTGYSEQYAIFGIYVQDTSNNSCVIPDYIEHYVSILYPEEKFPIRLSNSKSLDNVLDLYLPHNLWGMLLVSGSGAKIQNIYFDGTAEEYSAKQFIGSWTNDFVTCIQCCDTNLPIEEGTVKRYKAELQYVGSTFGLVTPGVTEEMNNVTLQFDLSEIEYVSGLFTNIQFVDYAAGAKKLSVYIDGETADETKYSFDTDTNVFSFNDYDDYWKGHNLVIKAPGTFVKGGYAASIFNGINALEVKNNRIGFYVGQSFNVNAVHAFYKTQTGYVISAYEISHQYLTFSSDFTCQVGHVFSESEIGTHTITVKDSILGVSGTYTISVTQPE